MHGVVKMRGYITAKKRTRFHEFLILSFGL